ncbi:MAG: hypothetical protein BroJett011_59660 [Chloroflexota bacterium]|nr:MAG: hypothetical protein BroJett011_59660 [Chloroflexota bacterium]
MANKMGDLIGIIAARLTPLTQQVSQQLDQLSSSTDQTINRLGQFASPVATKTVNFLEDERRVKPTLTLGILAAGAVVAGRAGLSIAAVSGAMAGVNQATRIMERSAKTAGMAPSVATLAGMMKIPFRPSGFKATFLGAGLKLAVEVVTTKAGNELAEATKSEDMANLTQVKRNMVFFKSQKQIPRWRSNLTPLLNRSDVIGTINSHHLVSSEGVMFKTAGITWHRGTSVIQMPDGQRTLSHVQSLQWPAIHYYFDQPLSDEQAVGLATGELKPQSVPGYVGSISKKEGLMPLWANTKRAMLLIRLHWPPKLED